ncbi:MAG: hypothetical protein ACK5LT_12265 [Lachnospirales bacterium]
MNDNFKELDLKKGGNKNSNSSVKPEAAHHSKSDDVLNIKLGLIIPHRELADPSTMDKLNEQLITETSVKYLSEQFNRQLVKYNVVEVEAISEATATILDEVIGEDYSINSASFHPATMSIALDIGSYSTDFVAMLGVDIINDSEKRLKVGTDDLFVEIMNELEDKYDIAFELLDMDNIAASLRYSTTVCQDCGDIVGSNADECRCGGSFVAKKNIVRIGRHGFDITPIVDSCIDKITTKIVEYFSAYIRRLFRLRGVALNQLENLTISGGGAELFGDNLISMLEKDLGELVNITKANKPVRKNVEGLSKLIYRNNNRTDVDLFVAVDVGCSSVKSKIIDKNGEEIIKGIELPSRISSPVKMSTYNIRKVKPLADLHVSITTDNNSISDGEYFVGQFATKGSGQVKQSDFTNKCEDKVFYVLANTSVATLIARHNHKLKNF